MRRNRKTLNPKIKYFKKERLETKCEAQRQARLTFCAIEQIFKHSATCFTRCQGSGDYSTSSQCVLNYAVYGVDPVAVKINAWAAEMSAYVHASILAKPLAIASC